MYKRKELERISNYCAKERKATKSAEHVNERFVQKASLGFKGGKPEDVRVAQKLFVAMVLRDCINELPYELIKEKYAIDLAGIRGLQASKQCSLP
eukprot:1151414-Pelagomonas_calceolata.AAC.3